jgi:hypothetical protein
MIEKLKLAGMCCHQELTYECIQTVFVSTHPNSWMIIRIVAYVIIKIVLDNTKIVEANDH